MTEASILVCPHCGTLNRVPAGRLDHGPKCGECRGPLLPGEPIELDGPRLDRLLAKDGRPLLLDLWAPWCGPCRSFAPTFAAAAARLPTIRFGKLDTEAHPEAAARFAVRAVPTLIAFRGGREVARRSGAMPLAELLRFAESVAG